jgi:predicted CoA-binding protein
MILKEQKMNEETNQQDKAKMQIADINEFLDHKHIFAVIGVSRDPEKYGSKVYLNLKMTDHEVYPINPNTDSVLGDKCYPTLKDLPVKPDVVSIVVPPNITEKIVIECRELGIDKVWMQPGSESEAMIQYCNKNHIKAIFGVCIITDGKKLFQ